MIRIAFTSLALLLGLSAVAGAGEVTGRGDFEFFMDAAAFRIDDTRSLQEVYIRIANPSLRFKEVDGRLTSQVRLSVLVKDADGKEVARRAEDLDLTAANESVASDPLQFQTLIKRFKLDAGSYTLSCTVEDRFAPKITVVGMVKGEHASASVEDYPLDVGAFPVEFITLSDAKFLWKIDRAGEVPVQHPNPARLYGLYRDSVLVYIEAYLTREVSERGDVELETVILDDSDQVASRAAVQLPPAANAGDAEILTYPLLIQEDLNRLPAGTYTLFVNARTKEQLMTRVRCGAFHVAWDMRTWEISRRDYIAEARFLLDPKEFELFLSKPVGEQEQMLAEAWKKVDPDPMTGVNEAYEEFIRRLDYVRSKYADYQTGVLSDRGMIYLKYGPPDELVQEVIPVNRETISDAMEKVYDRFHTVNFSNWGGRQGYARPARNIVVDPRRISQVGEGGEVAPAYELWVYNRRGKPLLERDMSLDPDIGMRFIFVDRDGYGRYKLESSSSMNQK